MNDKFVLSLFSGIDLLGMAFKKSGFCVVSAGDILFGSDIREWRTFSGIFGGVILGSPCQAWSAARHGQVTATEREEAKQLIAHGARIIHEAKPTWWLWENVPSVPNIILEGYTHQRFDITHAECGGVMLRRRHFQFGMKKVYNSNGEEYKWWNMFGSKLLIKRQLVSTKEQILKAPVGRRSLKTPWPELLRLFDLPQDFKLPAFTRAGKYLAIRNGVPLKIGIVIATAISDLLAGKQPVSKLCRCGCARSVTGQKQFLATPACRKRMQRRREGKQQETLCFPEPKTAMGAGDPTCAQ